MFALNRRNLPSDSHQANEPDEEIRWVYVATAPDQLLAEIWQQLLHEEAIPSMLAPQDIIPFLGVTPTPVRLVVPREMKTTAEEVLARCTEGGFSALESEKS